MFKVNFFAPNTDYPFSIKYIRHKVFVDEQNVPEEEEFDGLDTISTQVLICNDDLELGTCRIRKTENGIKLERFAILKEYRGENAGMYLLNEVLKYLQENFADESLIYLHAQEQVVNFYKKVGFETVGALFYECEIPHFKMILKKK